MKKLITFKEGYIFLFKKYEINWSIYDWAIPLSIDFSSDSLFFIRLFCFTLVIYKNDN